jgi:hypothetical protein
MIGQKFFSMSIYGFQNLFLRLNIIIFHHGKCLNTRDPDQIPIPVPTSVEISNPDPDSSRDIPIPTRDPVLEHCWQYP